VRTCWRCCNGLGLLETRTTMMVDCSTGQRASARARHAHLCVLPTRRRSTPLSLELTVVPHSCALDIRLAPISAPAQAPSCHPGERVELGQHPGHLPSQFSDCSVPADALGTQVSVTYNGFLYERAAGAADACPPTSPPRVNAEGLVRRPAPPAAVVVVWLT
jgi:hypothetical protein